LTDKGCIIWLYMTTTLLIILLSMLKEKDFNSIPLLSVSKPGWPNCIKLTFTIP
jgi:N6-adenosine-specific RNA methylase IME4